jgi:hypothetical protein
VVGYNLGDQILNLTAGTYDFTFTQGACVSNTVSITLTDPAGTIIADGGFTDPTTCAGTDGTITISGTGTGDLSWTGTNPGNVLGYNLGDQILNLTAGTYDFTFTQGACVSNTVSITLTDPAGAVIADGGFTDPTTCAGTDGTITISGTGTGDLSWTGTNPGNVIGYNLGDQILNLSAGTYDFTFTQGACVSNTVSITLTDPAGAVIADGGFTDPTTCAGTDGTITISGTGTGDLSWTGTNPGNVLGYNLGDQILNLSAGTYDFTFTQGACVSNTVSFTLTDPAGAVIADGGFTDPTTCAGTDGTITISGTGTGDLAWTGTNPGNVVGYNLGDQILNLSAGTYDFTFTQGACVSNTVSITLTDPAGAVIADGGFTDPTTCAGTDGRITISGTGTGDLSWTGTNPGNVLGYNLGDQILNLSAGTYDFTFTQGACVSNTVSITLTDPAGTIIADGGFTDPTTCAGTDGTITISGTGTGNLSWTGTNPGNVLGYNLGDQILNLSAGTYDFTFTQGACVSNTVSITLTDPAGALISQGATFNPFNCLGSDGEIEISGIGTGDISWSGTSTGSVLGATLPQTITGFTAGTYDFTFNDGCISNTISVTLNDPTPVAISEGFLLQPSACGNTNGQIEILGLGSGTISWTGTTMGSFAVILPINLPNFGAGTYDITLFDANLCNSNTLTVTLSDPGAIVISNGGVISPSTCGGSDAEIIIAGSGTGDLSWTGTSTGSIIGHILGDPINGFSAGTYDFTFDNAGCLSNTLTINVTDPSAPATPVITPSGPTSICNGNTVTLTSSSLVDNVWSTGETTQSIVVSTSNMYTVFVQTNGCSSNISGQLVDVFPQIIITTGATQNPSACGNADGSIEITGVGTGDVSYFNGTTTLTDVGVTLPYTITGLTAGTYDISIDNGCVSNTVSANISDPGAPALPTITAGSSTTFCDGGSVVLSSSSPTDNLWSTGETTQDITVTVGGTYSLLLSVAGCNSPSAFEIVTVNAIPTTPTISSSDADNIICDGEIITLTSSSAVDNLWSTGETTQSINVTTSQLVNVTVLTNGCSAISNDETITVNPVTPTSVSIAQTGGDTYYCASLLRNDGGLNIGTYTATTIGYTNTPTFIWRLDGVIWGSDLSFIDLAEPLGGGNLTVEVISNDACSNPTNLISNALFIDVISTSPPTLSEVGTASFCQGSNLNLSITDFNPTNVYNWSTGETGVSSITISTPGIYNVTTSINACYSESSLVTVAETPVPATPTITASGATTFCDGDFVTLTSSSVADNVWSTGETTQSIDVSTSELINVSVITNGCSASSTDEIVTVNPMPTIPTISASGATTICDGEFVTLTSSSPTDNLWSTGETTQSINVLTAGVYNVTVSLGTCSEISADETIIVNPIPATPIITASGLTTFCDGEFVTLTSSSLTDNVWSTGETTQSIDVSSSEIINVSVVTNGCSATSTDEIITVNPIPTIPTISASGATDICIGDNVILTSSSPTDNLWSTGETTQSITVSSSGSYTVEVTNGLCNSNSLATIVNVNSTPPAVPTISANGPTTFCQGDDVVLTSSSPTNNLWSTGETTQSITVNSTDNISVSINIGGCLENSTLLNIVVNPIPATPIITSNGPTTLCSGSNVILTSSSGTGNLWSNGATTPSIAVTNSGNYSVAVTELGCTSLTASLAITVNPTPNAPLIFVTGSTSFCEGGSVQLSSSLPNNITWSTGATTQAITVSSTQNVTVTASVAGCSSTSNVVNVIEHPNPVVSIADYDDVCNTTAPFSYTNGIPSGGTYQLNGSPSIEFNPAFAFIGLNALEYTLIDQYGCTGTASTNINVLNCISVEEEEINKFTVYPNPTNGLIFVKGETIQNLKRIEVRDQLGRLVFVQTELALETMLNLSDLADGTYNLILIGENFESIERIQLTH